ncbi:MAG: stage III sporulation protein AE [Lachnospiraceae bacterium]|nr:stage III sporulation protein AE [Lachnospiraceae bacterium]
MLIIFFLCSTDGLHHNYIFSYSQSEIIITEDNSVDDSSQDTPSSQSSDYISDSYAYDKIFDELDLDSIDRELKRSNINISVDFKDIVRDIINNKGNVSYDMKSIIMEVLIGELSSNKNLMLQLISIVLLGSIFVKLSNSFGTGFISENGFYITYLIITAIMLASFMVTLDMVSSTLEALINIIRIIIPIYALAINFIGHTASSAAMYEVIMVGIWLVQNVVLNIILPMIRFYVIIMLVNNLSKEDYFSKMCKLVNNMVNWMLKTIIFFIAGLNIIKSLIEPQMDLLGKNVVNKVVSAIPTGTMMSVLTGTFLGAGIIVKNSIGIAGLIVIVIALIAPILKALIIMLLVRVTAVLLQPIGEKRYVEGVWGLAQGINLLLLSLISSAALFLLTIAIMAFATNAGGG